MKFVHRIMLRKILRVVRWPVKLQIVQMALWSESDCPTQNVSSDCLDRVWMSEVQRQTVPWSRSAEVNLMEMNNEMKCESLKKYYTVVNCVGYFDWLRFENETFIHCTCLTRW